MADATLTLIDPPQFLICDDVRTEIGGKQILIGVYPGNTIVLDSVPGPIICRVWSILMPWKVGPIGGIFRVVRVDDEKTMFESNVNMNIKVSGQIVPVILIAQCDIDRASELEARVRIGAEDWIRLGKFQVISQADQSRQIASPRGANR